MKKLLVILGVVMVMIGSAYGGLRYYIGMQVRQSMDAKMVLLKDIGIFTVDKSSYKEGWFGAEAETTISFSKAWLELLGADQPFPTFTFKTSIRTGLLPYKAYANTEFVLNKETKKVLKEIFGVENPLKIEDTILLDGSGTLNITLHPIDTTVPQRGQIKFDGIQAHWDYKLDKHKHIVVDSMNIKAPKLDLQYYEDNLGILVSGFHCKRHNSYHENPVVTGVGECSLDTIIAHLEGGDFQLHQLSFGSDAKIVGEFFNDVATFKLGELSWNKEVYGPFKVQLSLNHLDVKALKLWFDYMNKLSHDGITGYELGVDMGRYLITDASDLLTNNPEFNIDEIYFKHQNDELKAKGSLKLSGLAKDDLPKKNKPYHNLRAFSNKLKADFEYSAPERLIMNLIESCARAMITVEYYGGPGLSGPDGEQQIQDTIQDAQQKVKDVIRTGESLGYIKVVNGVISGSIKLEQGKLYINGHEVYDVSKEFNTDTNDTKEYEEHENNGSEYDD